MKNKREELLYPIVSKYFAKKGYYIFREFPFIEKSNLRVDVFAVEKNFSHIISVEVKMKWFRKAVEQALVRLYFSDYVYLAFPERYAQYVLKKYIDVINELNLGILAIDGCVKELKKASKSPLLVYKLKESILNRLRKIIS